MASKKSNKSDGEGSIRALNWTFIVYPESAPDNWREILDDFHVEWVESPLHDKDINANGELKKPHWHIWIGFSGVKSFDQVRDITEVLNAPIPKQVHNSRAMIRYMAHLDNPEKAQYSVSDIVGHGGVDIKSLLKANSSERYSLIKEMLNYINANDILEFQDIMDYATSERFDDWFPLLCDNSAYIINLHLKSRRHRRNKTVDYSTGEIIDD